MAAHLNHHLTKKILRSDWRELGSGRSSGRSPFRFPFGFGFRLLRFGFYRRLVGIGIAVFFGRGFCEGLAGSLSLFCMLMLLCADVYADLLLCAACGVAFYAHHFCATKPHLSCVFWS